MAIFLDGLQNKILFDFGIQFKTAVSPAETGVEQRRQRWAYPRRSVKIECRYLTGADMDTAWDFYVARKGSYEKFTWFYPVSDTYTYENVGMGDGTTDTFDILGKDTSSVTVYVDRVAQTVTTDYSIGDGTGTDGRDQIIFVSAPTNGARIEVSYTGTLGLYYRFKDDGLSKPVYTTALANWGVEILEVKVS